MRQSRFAFILVTVVLGFAAFVLSNCTPPSGDDGTNGGGGDEEEVPVTGVTVAPTSNLVLGDTQQLTATVLPANATNKNVTWSSNDTNVATVSASALVTAGSVGSATITVTTVDGNFTDTCSVTVSADENPLVGTWVNPAYDLANDPARIVINADGTFSIFDKVADTVPSDTGTYIITERDGDIYRFIAVLPSDTRYCTARVTLTTMEAREDGTGFPPSPDPPDWTYTRQ